MDDKKWKHEKLESVNVQMKVMHTGISKNCTKISDEVFKEFTSKLRQTCSEREFNFENSEISSKEFQERISDLLNDYNERMRESYEIIFEAFNRIGDLLKDNLLPIIEQLDLGSGEFTHNSLTNIEKIKLKKLKNSLNQKLCSKLNRRDREKCIKDINYIDQIFAVDSDIADGNISKEAGYLVITSLLKFLRNNYNY